MNAKLKKLALTLTLTTILLCVTFINIKVVHSNITGGKIDLFTQKEPYSGKGRNTRSDAFGPGEEVQIYALATYNEDPVSNLLVAFEILGPQNSVANITSHRIAFTNETGLAKISFRISRLNETTFGEWTVVGNVRIGDLTVKDLIMFKVGWIVEIVSLKTMNKVYIEQESFPSGSYLGVEVVLRNIAMTEKKTTLTITIYDSLNTFVNATELSDFSVQPNETLVHADFFLYLPKTALAGCATVYACAYTALNGLPYCPEVSKHFLITGEQYFLKILTEAGGTTDPAPGTYNYPAGSTVQVKAFPSENYIFDHWELDGVDVGSANSYSVLMDRNHTLKAVFSPTPAGWFVPEWFFWLLLPLLILIIVLLAIWLYRRRRKKAEEAFYSGWTAWYYCYDLRSKTRRFRYS